MAWTTPPNFSTAVLSSTVMNQVARDDLNYLLSGKAVIEKCVLLVADKTLTMPQATWTNLDHTNYIVTLPATFSSGRVRIDISFVCVVTNVTGTKANFDISIDNLTYSGSGSVNANGTATATPLTQGLVTVSDDTGYSGSTPETPIHMTAIITGLTPGVTHTFELMYTTSGTGVAKVLNTYHMIYIIAEEI